MKEIWRDIKGFEGLYQVSNLGKVKSLDRKVRGKYGRMVVKKGKLLKPVLNHSGYERVGLHIYNTQKHKFVHRLVAEAFIPNPNNLPFINHKDENKLNNRVYFNEDGTIDYIKSNLEWCSAKYNSNYGTIKERINKSNVTSGRYKDYTGWKEEDIITDRKSRYQRNNKEYYKKYYEEHKEELKEYQKKYYQEHKRGAQRIS